MAKSKAKLPGQAELEALVATLPEKKPEKFTEQVKFTPEFQEKMRYIAMYASELRGRVVPQAEIIEKKLARWVAMAHLVVVRLNNEKAEAKAAESSESDDQ